MRRKITHTAVCRQLVNHPITLLLPTCATIRAMNQPPPTYPLFFNTAGPVDCARHYCIPPIERFDLPQILQLINQQKYFILHAPRQVGKTSFLLALTKYLNESGQYTCLYTNAEVGQTAREDVSAGMKAIIGELVTWAEITHKDDTLRHQWRTIWQQHGPHGALAELLTYYAQRSPKPFIFLLDEIDSLVGDTLISVLRQLRAGYARRPAAFPQSVILCGVRDVRDYRIYSSEGREMITGGSAFNIKAESLRMGDFTEQEVRRLCGQHTEVTGQPFTPEALALVWELTQGQPWLVNALAYEVTEKLARDKTIPITPPLIQEAKEKLIARRETHLDQLIHKLQEERVRRVIGPILAGETNPRNIPSDDILYLKDLGLIKGDPGQHLAIANPIYQEIIPRELTFSTQLTITHQTAWYVNEAGLLDFEKLLTAFQQFFREHSEHWVERFDYKEAGPQLLLQAFLQRIVNGGGRVEREYGLGRMRTDLAVFWPYPEGEQRVVLELKLRHKTLEQTIAQGLVQTVAYMERMNTAVGHLIIFDRRPEISWDEKIFCEPYVYEGQAITVWGM